ncbi:MAG: outer membrane protein assembly factor BamA [Verrucomicrobiota bacterium]
MKSSAIIPFVCATAITAALPSTGFAQGKAPTVKSIEVQYAGSAGVSKDRLLANMRTRVGQPYSEVVVEEDIRNLYATGNVMNVRIYGEPAGEDGVKVIVVLQAKAKVTVVELAGVQKFKESRIREKISTKPGDAANESSLEADRQAILEYYRGKGFTDVSVSYKMDTNERLGTVHVRFDVSEGGKSAIKEVRFVGNTSLSSKELKKVVKTRRYGLLSPIMKTGRVVQDQLTDDVTAIREYYQNKGYSDVQVRPAELSRDGGKVDVVFTIEEGTPYKVGAISFAGAHLFPEEKIQSVTKLRSGDVYSPAAVQADVKALQDLYGGKGYVDFQASARSSSGGKGTTNINYSLDEGSQAFVGHVNISGNTRTKDKVVRRELALAPGDSFNTVRMEASKQRLKGLNYFETVDLYPSDTGASDARDLNVVLQEKRTGSLNFGAGFSSLDSLLGFVEVTQSNFDLFNWPHFTGGGQKFRSRIQYGAKRKDASLSLTEPYFLDQKLSLGGEVFYHDASYVSDIYSEQRVGFELVARKPVTEFAFARLGYRVEQIGIHDVDAGASALIKSQVGDRVKSQIFTGLTYDTRDSLFLTRKGGKVDVSTFVAGGPLGGDIQSYGWNIEGSKYFKVFGDTIFTLNGQVSGVDGWGNSTVGIPIYDRLFVGGSNDMRGFKYRHVGGVGKVRDTNGEPIGGKSLARATFEYTVPVMDKVRAATFYDIGFVNENAYDFTTSGYNADVGLGLRLELPIGPVRIDYAVPTKVYPNDSARGRFNFNVGYQF